MPDTEPPAGQDGSDSSGIFSAILSSTPKTISGIAALIGAVTGLVIALNKAGILGPDAAPDPVTIPEKTTDASAPLFDPKNLGGGEGRARLKKGTLYINAREATKATRVLTGQDKPPADVSVSASVKRISGVRDWSFSMLCRFRDSRSFYLFQVIPRTHQYNIAVQRDSKLRSLSGVQTSNAIRTDENNVTATCNNNDPTILKLKVNGETVKTVYVKNGIESGDVGVRAGSAVGPVTAAFANLKRTSP